MKKAMLGGSAGGPPGMDNMMEMMIQ